MRTFAGYLFTCKECGHTHLLDGEPHRGIIVPCAYNEDKSHSYLKKNFKYWHGWMYEVCGAIVEEKK